MILAAAQRTGYGVARLAREHETLNPARITRRINQIQQQLIELAAARTQGTRPAA